MIRTATVLRHFLGTLLTLVLLALPAWAAAEEAATEPSAWQRAQELSRQGKWGEAATAYREHLADHDQDAWSWFALASIRHGSGDFTGAVDGFQKALDAKIGVPAVAHYNMASSLARMKQNDKALKHLAEAAPSGLWSAETWQTDPDLASLADSPHFAELAREADLANRPCELLPAYQQFDFWLGHWQVRIPTGFPAARDEITKSEDGCVIIQAWRGTLGAHGQSYSFYDTATETWHQTWVGKSGSVTKMEGKMIGDRMVLESVGTTPGSRTRTSWIPQPDGTVDFRTETTTDDGATWAPAGLMHYHRAE